jgi:adenylate cyclase
LAEAAEMAQQAPEVTAEPREADTAALDLALWQSVGDNGVEGLLRYLERFPEGEFATIARDRIAALAAEDPQSGVSDATALDADTAVELTFWESVQASDNPAMYEAYLEKYPQGEFAPLAKVRLDELRQ